MTDSGSAGKFDIAVEATVMGVALYVRDTNSGRVVRIGVVQPDDARDIARNITLRSFEVEDMRKALGIPDAD